MEKLFANYYNLRTDSMTNLNLTVLSYHEFYTEPNEYAYSRTYARFREDLNTKLFDLITIDDGHIGCLKAFEMMRQKNIRGILFVPSSLMGQGKYLSWSQINHISKHHEIGNHSHHHVNLQELTPAQIQEEILTCNSLIEKHTGKRPRFFVPPFNRSNKHIDNLADKFGLQIIRNRVDIINTTP